MKIDVGITVRNPNPEVWKAVLAAVEAQAGLNRVIIYDDASDAPGAKELIASAPHVVLRGEIPVGPGGGRNVILRRSEADLVVFNDADDVPRPNRLTTLVAFFTKHVMAVGVTSHFDSELPGKMPDNVRGDYTTTRRLFEHSFSIPVAGICVRRDAVIAAGVWFPEGLALHDDTLFVLRLAAAFPFRLDVIRTKLWRAGLSPDGGVMRARRGRNPWTQPNHTYLHHALPALLSAARTAQNLKATGWGDRLNTELVAPDVRAALGLPATPPPAAEPQGAPAVVTTPSGPGPIVYAGHDIREHHAFVRGWAEAEGRPYDHFKLDGDLFKKGANLLKRAAFVVIWNGCQSHGRNIAAICETMKVPVAFFEWGIAPQNSTFLVDLKGMVNRSMLMDPLSWVTEDDIAAFETAIAPVRAAHPLEPRGGRVLVPLQIENDTQVLYSGNWRDMREFIDHIRSLYPGREVVVRPHPKSGNQYRTAKIPGVTIEDKETVPDFLDAARISDVVVGINSTSLTEAAMLGVPVVALGDCPLRAQPPRHLKRLLAGYWALRVPRSSHVGAVLKRFHHRPID